MAGITVDESLCFPPTTVDSADPAAYRHFAVDDVSDTVYFCDLNPYRDGMFCYCSNRKDPDHKNKWIGENIFNFPKKLYIFVSQFQVSEIGTGNRKYYVGFLSHF